MLCQNCGKNEATFHYQYNINGSVTERHLCAQCAHESGEESFFFKPSDYMGSMLSDFFGGIPSLPSRHSAVKCPLCGATERDIAATGKAGCAQCYSVFDSLLTPYVRRIHGSAPHAGKIPSAEGKELKAKRELEELKVELKKAVDEQEFERAAQLRDKIRDMEKEVGGNEQ